MKLFFYEKLQNEVFCSVRLGSVLLAGILTVMREPTGGKRLIPTFLILTVLLSLVLVHGDKTHICSHILFIFCVILIFFGVIL